MFRHHRPRLTIASVQIKKKFTTEAQKAQRRVLIELRSRSRSVPSVPLW